MLTKAALTISAQAVSSLTNFLVGAFALAVGTLGEFGHFSIALQLCIVVIAIGQGSTGTTILIHGAQSQSSDSDMLPGTARAAMVTGVACAIVFVVAGLVVDGDIGRLLLISAPGCPGLVAQYTMRSVYFARFEYAKVVLLDTVWLVVLLVAGAAAWLASWSPGPGYFLVAWLVGGSVSAIPLFLIALRSQRSSLRYFWQQTGPQAVKLGVDNLLARSVLSVALVSTSIVLDDTASGSLAAATLLFSPLTIVNASIASIVVPPEIRKRGVHVVRRSLPLMVIAATMLVTVAWAATLVLIEWLGFAAGPFRLSANEIGTGLFIATLLRFLAFAAWRGPAVGLRIADAASESLDARIRGTVLQWVLPVVGLLLGGLSAGAMGFAIATWIGALLTWHRYVTLGQPKAATA
ncbi:MAG: hypothetical protein OER95_09120 [Acidimicrobiia bacterium]|nr:hypothetical protein [Acidimicrobiia bacterium]